MRQGQLMRQLGPPPSLRFLETRSELELNVGEVKALLQEYVWLSTAMRATPHELLAR
jgi:hypothetical protein